MRDWEERWALAKAFAPIDRDARRAGVENRTRPQIEIDRSRPRITRTWFAYWIDLDWVTGPEELFLIPHACLIRVSRLTGRATYAGM